MQDASEELLACCKKSQKFSFKSLAIKVPVIV